jgi:hypothetical protein
MTPEEVHAKYAFGPRARCAGCRSQKVVMRAIVMAPFSDVANDNAFGINQDDPAELFKVLVPLRGSDGKPVPFVRLNKAYACKNCGPAFERYLAKLPSYFVVEINRGPGTDKPLVQVA